MNIKEQIKKLSGEQAGSNFPKLPYAPELKMQGDEGFFFLETRNDEGVYEKTSLESPLKVVLLRKRRRLVDMSDKGLQEISSEHDAKTDEIFLFKRRERGIAEDLRKKYPDLRTQELYYSIYNGDIVKLVIKGSSLIRGEKKPPESVPLYEYLQSFQGTEHVSGYETVITPVQEGKGKRVYYAMSFARGEEFNDEKLLGGAVEFLEELNTAISAQKKSSSPIKSEDEIDLSVLDEDKKELNAKDLPF